MNRYESKSCWLCGRNGAADPLDRHHIFGGARRKASEKYGLVVYLCHHDCHEYGPEAAHRCAETAEKLHKYGQRKAMAEQGWTVDEFRLHFGWNYLDDEELEDVERAPKQPAPNGFKLIPAADMPF